MTDEVKLHVGYVGRTRDGKRVEILGTGGPDGYPFKGDNGKTYNEFGMWSHKYPRSENDIIGPWEEPTTEYPVGQWIGWNGGECPVHPETVVDYVWHDPDTNRCGYGSQRKAVEAGSVRLAWRNVVKFRIVTPYVEPKPPLECWVNVYSDGCKIYFDTKDNADTFSQLDPIRCVRMVEADQ